jgi:hypothetical protein
VTRWEYCTLTRKGETAQVRVYGREQRQSTSSDDLESLDGGHWSQALVMAGQQRWDLVSVVYVGDGDEWHFKRPKAE